MIQHDFNRFGRSETVGLSDTRFEFVVQSLHGPKGELSTRFKPVEDERFVGAEHVCDFPHGPQARAQGLGAPLIHEFLGPRRGDVLPEQMELFLEQVGAYRAQVAGKHVLELDGLLRGQILHPLEQAPARVGQHDFYFAQAPARRGFPCLLGAHLIDRLVHFRGDVVAIENVQRPLGPLGDHVQVRLPHIRTDELDQTTALRAEPQKELSQARFLTVLADEQQTHHALIDLIDQGQKLALLPVDLIDPQRRDSAQVHARPTPVDGHFHRAKHTLPAGFESPRDLLPAQQLGPTGQKPGEALRQRTLAQRPRHVFHADPTVSALDPSGRIDEESRQAPQRHELKASLGQSVIPARRFLAPRALAPRALALAQLNFNSRDLASLAPGYNQPARFVNKPFQPLHIVEQRFQQQVHNLADSGNYARCDGCSPRSSRLQPTGVPAHAAAALHSSASSPPITCRSPGNSPADALMSIALSTINAVTAASSRPRLRVWQRSSVAPRWESNCSAKVYAERHVNPRSPTCLAAAHHSEPVDLSECLDATGGSAEPLRRTQTLHSLGQSAVAADRVEPHHLARCLPALSLAADLRRAVGPDFSPHLLPTNCAQDPQFQSRDGDRNIKALRITSTLTPQ